MQPEQKTRIAATNQAATAAQRVVDARRMVEQVKELAKQAEDDFKSLMTALGEDSVQLANGTLVTKVEAERRNFKADILARLVTADIFAEVTTTKVDAKKFDAAKELGHVSESDVADAIRYTPYTAVRITE